ncbi:MAG: hypothetical protein LBF36_02650, partial [Mycoplasmataceae bacterium]|nr:hypothetical protein [Mycoplasmataceae bacterium]
MKKISLRTILLTTFIPAIVMPIALSTSCSKNNIWTKTFENGDDLLEWAADFPIIKDSPTFKDGYESATWFSNHMNNEFVAKLIVNNILQRF